MNEALNLNWFLFFLPRTAAPEFIGDMYDVTRSVEEDAEFECQASGVPGPIITWTVDGKVLSGTPLKHIHVYNICIFHVSYTNHVH